MALTDLPTHSRVLVLRALGLGDFLTAVPALRALRRGLPEPVITLAAPAALDPLVRLAGVADRLLPTPDLESLGVLAPPLDLAVNLHGSGPQSVHALRRTGARRILTHAHPDLPGQDGPEWNRQAHEVDRWCRLVEWAGLPADPRDLRLRVPAERPVVEQAVVIHPGAGSPARRWPVARFAYVAAELARRGHRVVITGSRSEVPLARELAARAAFSEETVLAGRLDLAQLASLVSGARLVICGDTGIGHLASAYEVPSVLLFGPTPPALWGPPPGPHTVLWSGGIGDPHGNEVDPGLLQIEVAPVLTAALELLAETR